MHILGMHDAHGGWWGYNVRPYSTHLSTLRLVLVGHMGLVAAYIRAEPPKNGSFTNSAPPRPPHGGGQGFASWGEWKVVFSPLWVS